MKRHIVLLIVISLAFIPAWDGKNCEEVAKISRNAFGYDLVFVNPAKESGALILGDYSGHFLNYNGRFYLDRSFGIIAKSKEDYIKEYIRKTGHQNAEMWNLNHESTPFKIKWHYPDVR